MGYPMTYQRVLRRNRLEHGSYGDAADQKPRVLGVLPPKTLTEQNAYRISIYDALVEQIQRYEDAFALLQGDLRRLETDTRDEEATCKHIAYATGLDPEVVAIVLAEFIAW